MAIRAHDVTTPLDQLPEVLTVEEAAAVLRIARGAAYELTRVYRATNGREGLPVVRLGRTSTAAGEACATTRSSRNGFCRIC